MSDREFTKNNKYRLNKGIARSLIEELAPHIPSPGRGDEISVETKVLTALAFYASGSYQTGVGQSTYLNVSQKVVSRAVKQVTEALNRPEILPKYIKWPNQEEKRAIKAKFFSKFGLPGVIGCIDGTQIAMIRPKIHDERYFNRKGYHSLNVMIICDSELNILCVDPSNPGSAHDSRVWHGHPISRHLNQMLENGEQDYLLGDSGYPLRRTMMTPILDTVEGTPQNYYYKKHVTARNTVERCIGVLKARFRCLLNARTLHYDPASAGRIVNACCVLHNIANKCRAPVPALTEQEIAAENVHRLQGEEVLRAEIASAMNIDNPNSRRMNPDLVAGRAMQQALVNTLWNRNR